MRPLVDPAVARRARSVVLRAVNRVARRLASADGFTLVETLVASVVLIVGLMGSFLLLDISNRTSGAVRERAAGVNLAREISEDSRSIPFAQLAPSTIVEQLQAMPGLANAGSGSTWLINRSGFTYTVTATECSIDLPSDGYGVHDTTFCSDSSTTGTTDSTPIDMKRVAVNVSWTALHATHSVTETAEMTSAGQALGLQATALKVYTTPTSLAGSTSPTVTAAMGNAMNFQVTVPPGATGIHWLVDGAVQSSWSTTSAVTGAGGTYYSTNWDITNLPDGTYQIGAQAEDANSVIGPAVTIPVILSRNIPSAPKLSATEGWYGFNTHLPGFTGNVVELQWQANSEKNVTGYRIYNPSGTLICTTTQGGGSATSNQYCGPSGSTNDAWCSTPAACIDLNPPAATASNLTYQVAALYTDSSGATQEGPRASATMAGTSSDKFTFSPTTGNTGTNCSGATTLMDMLGSYSAGSTDSTASGSITFCSDAFSSGQTVEGGGTATAYFENTGATPCVVTATLSTDGSSTGAVTGVATIVPLMSSPAASTLTFTNNQLLTMNTGDRLDLKFDMTAAGCGSTVLHYGSTSAPSAFQTTPIPITAPSAPASLNVTGNADGTGTLTWPDEGSTISFYRIYRGGANYTNRYDILPENDCAAGTCTYNDVKRTGSQTYSISAVGGTTPGSNMSESGLTGPVSG